MPFTIDEKSDIVYFFIEGRNIVETSEVGDGIIADYDVDGRLIGLEIRHASKRMNTPLSPNVNFTGTSSGNLTKQQHYVWASYLRAWMRCDSKISCFLIDKKKFINPSPDEIAKRSYFYRLHRLEEEDWKYLRWFASQASDQELRDLNNETINFFHMIYDVEDLFNASGFDLTKRPSFIKHFNFAEKMMGERYHGLIEQNAIPLLQKLRSKNAAFCKEAGEFTTFAIYLCQQMFRTRKIRDLIVRTFRGNPQTRHDPEKTGQIEQHIIANNVTIGLLIDWRSFIVEFLDNKTKTPFITGDQPVINLNKGQPELKIYYPLDPSLAIYFRKRLPGEEKCLQKCRIVGEIEIEHLNQEIFESSYTQIYGNDEAYLKSVIGTGKLGSA